MYPTIFETAAIAPVAIATGKANVLAACASDVFILPSCFGIPLSSIFVFIITLPSGAMFPPSRCIRLQTFQG